MQNLLNKLLYCIKLKLIIMKIILYDTLVWLSKNKHLEIEFQNYHNFRSNNLQLYSTKTGTKYFKYEI